MTTAEGRVTRVGGDTLHLFDLTRVRIVEGQDADCRAVRSGTVVVVPDTGMVVSATRYDPTMTTALIVSAGLVLAYLFKKFSEDCCLDD